MLKSNQETILLLLSIFIHTFNKSKNVLPLNLGSTSMLNNFSGRKISLQTATPNVIQNSRVISELREERK